ncbi:hypothetical protein BvCmsKSNP012_02434 [Escherichia coli]|nr:hypothetical protein BvCmsKSNP012_02434 [Escherichia coli]GDK00499.1 hypothetical protein BvCmsKSP054_00973 [Escherichia coli]GDN78351.1 hypothetical protein BvCmsNSNP006_05244 [Escherichia coli]
MINFRGTPFHNRPDNIAVSGSCRKRGNLTVFTKNQRTCERHNELFQLFVTIKHPVFGQRVPDDIDVFQYPLLVLIAGLVTHRRRLPSDRAPLTGSGPVSEDIALTCNILADLLLRLLRLRKQPANYPLGHLTATEVHTVNVIRHLLQEVFRGFDFGHRCLQGKVKKVPHRVTHNLLNKTLQLLAINKTE